MWHKSRQNPQNCLTPNVFSGKEHQKRREMIWSIKTINAFCNVFIQIGIYFILLGGEKTRQNSSNPLGTNAFFMKTF